MQFKTDYMDEIPADGKRIYSVVDDKTASIINKDIRLVRSNGNAQEGDVFGAEEANAFGVALNSLLSKKYTRDEYGIYTVPNNTDPLTLMYEGKYYTPNWLIGVLPVASQCCIIEVIHHTDAYQARTIIAHCPTYGYTFKNVMSNNVWSGWRQENESHTGLTYMNGWISNGHGPVISKIDKTVYFNAILRKGTNTLNTVMAIIPDGYRPVYGVVVIATTVDGNALLTINTNGNITIQSLLSDINNVQISAIWTVE